MQVIISENGQKILSSATANCNKGGAQRVKLHLKPSAFQNIVDSMNSGTERGGTFSIDTSNLTLDSNKHTNVGGTNDVETPHGIIEWHTHPSKCTMDECSLACPSDVDIRVFLEDALTDNLSHWVFSLLGTFVVCLSPSLVLRMRRAQDKGAFDSECQAIQDLFSALQDKFASRYITSKNEDEKRTHEEWHKTQWLKVAGDTGFAVTLFPWGVNPTVEVLFQCR
eukprot:jgi/Mesvir1/21652/Mv04073-RA.1